MPHEHRALLILVDGASYFSGISTPALVFSSSSIQLIDFLPKLRICMRSRLVKF